MTILDLETNAAYSRQRVAEIRALSGDDRGAPHIVSRRYTLAPLRTKLGAALILMGERLLRAPLPRQSSPAETRLSS